MHRLLFTALACLISLNLIAQLPDGSIAPDFTATDIDGNEWNLYQLLDEGKTVILEFTATWNSIDWNYAQSGVLNDLYSAYGPNGSENLMVFKLESDDFTTEADLNGTGAATTGDWVSITNYPIIDNAGNIFNDYSNSYYPTIYTVCPDKVLVQSGQGTLNQHIAAAFAPCDNYVNGVAPVMTYTGETSSCGGGEWSATTEIVNLGEETITAMIINVTIGGVNQNVEWTGSIETGASETIDLGMFTYVGTFNVSVTVVNGETWDLTQSVDIVGSEESTTSIQIRIMTDNWPEETGWSITNSNGAVVESSDVGAYTLGDNLYTTNVSLDLNECYTFTMIDTYGDGLNASYWGNYADGYAQIVNMDGDTELGFVLDYQGSSGVQFEVLEIGIFSSINTNTIIGCTNPIACNYDEFATEDDGSCLEFDECGICGGSGILEGFCDCDGNVLDALGVCGGDCSADDDLDGICDELEIYGCNNPLADNYNPEATEYDGSCEYITCIIDTLGYDTIEVISEIIPNITDTILIIEEDTFDIQIDLGYDTIWVEEVQFDINEICDTIYLPPEETSNGCLDPNACNYNSDIIISNPLACEYESCLGCIIEQACNYNPDATIDDGSCEFICFGCTDSGACNFDETANTNDESCEYESCSGCMDQEACNYDDTAIINDECVFPEEFYDCIGNCLNDTDFDGICDELEIYGCTEQGACNYNLDNTEEDGSCEYESCSGCQYELACNYDPNATIANNASCEFGTCTGCTDPQACNYNPTVLGDDGSCEYCSCNECAYGCTDETACNYNEFSIEDDGSCNYSCIFPDEYWLGIHPYKVHTTGELVGMTTWRLYLYTVHETDFLTSCSGDEENPWILESTSTPAWYNTPSVSELFANTINPVFFDEFPNLEYDSWLTIGASSTEDGIDISSYSNPNYNAFAAFENGENINSDSPFGNLWFTIFPGLEHPEHPGFAGEDLRVLVAQITTSGTLSGSLRVQIFPEGVQNPDIRLHLPIINIHNSSINGCLDESACNYNSNATVDDGSCLEFDECGVCGGSGILEEFCDCDGNVVDAIGICGGSCTSDFNSNGVCDLNEIFGCTYVTAINYNEEATADDGSCEFEETVSNDCIADLDGSGNVGSPDLLLFLGAYGEVCE